MASGENFTQSENYCVAFFCNIDNSFVISYIVTTERPKITDKSSLILHATTFLSTFFYLY